MANVAASVSLNQLVY